MSAILITGGAGFIGSHLAEAYASGGDEVFILDDLSTGAIRNLRNIRHLDNVHVTIDDARNKPVVAELVDQVDIVFHLAASVGVKLVVEGPVRTLENNIHGAETVLDAANKKKKTVVMASTSEVYGTSDKVPFSERDSLVLGNPYKGRWSYACSKALDEFMTMAYHEEKRLPTIIVRLFNTVGPRQTGRYGMVLPTFVKQALTGADITVHGSGDQTRCFTHVSDAVRGLRALAAEPKAVGHIYNIGSQQEVSILELAEFVKRLTNSSSRIVTVPYGQVYGPGFEDMPRRVPDLTVIGECVGYEPQVDLEATIESVIEYFLASENGD